MVNFPLWWGLFWKINVTFLASCCLVCYHINCKIGLENESGLGDFTTSFHCVLFRIVVCCNVFFFLFT